MSNEASEKVASGEAWTDFCELLKKAGDVLLRDDLTTSTFDRAEGHRYLTRLLRAGLTSFAETTGPQHPVFRAMPELVKMGLDNPDNYYLSAPVDARSSYRIRGQRGSIHYMSFAAQNQNFAARDRITGGAGHLNDSDLDIAADGSFEILVSQEEQPGSWLRMAPDTRQVLLRQTFLDKSRETPVEVSIERIDGDPIPPPLDPARVPGLLMGSAMYAMGCAQWFADWVIAMRDKAPMNTFHLPDEENHRLVGGDPNIRIWLGLWELADDQALVIEMTPPDCQYWNFQLGNIWAESLDYRFRRVHINSGQAELRDDGSVQLVVSSKDPGHPNWMDTAGHAHGTMCVRWVLADSHPEPKCRVVELSELR
ncbi:MAG: DUF1214 domain-containing protein [Deltaproteobacteria bacterium]|nr:DUF1214 domain-containing protein [Deltaproteobacteria bacterium]MBW2419979.1 DUF1214 domain-containing protein [Deltaproteobacteria bacterium]